MTWSVPRLQGRVKGGGEIPDFIAQMIYGLWQWLIQYDMAISDCLWVVYDMHSITRGGYAAISVNVGEQWK